MTENKTFNPAGMPTVKPAGTTKPYTREDYVRDLRKVSSKKDKPASGKA